MAIPGCVGCSGLGFGSRVVHTRGGTVDSKDLAGSGMYSKACCTSLKRLEPSRTMFRMLLFTGGVGLRPLSKQKVRGCVRLLVFRRGTSYFIINNKNFKPP